MSMEDRTKLETAIERETYRFVEVIKEHMYDYTMIYLNRNQVDIDRQVADRLLQIAKAAVEDGLLSKMDFYKKGIDAALTEFTEAENPLPRGKQPKGQKE